jgi:hypothetical protein
MNRKDLLLDCMRGMILFEDRFDSVEPEDAKWLCERLAWHKIIHMAAAMSDPQKRKCPDLERVFRDCLVAATFREAEYLKQIRSLFEILTEASIGFIPYKGPFWCQELYPDYSWRHIGDVDLFLGKEAARKVSSLLQKLGYKPVIVKGSEDEDFARRGELTLYPGPTVEHKLPVQLHWALLPSHRFVDIGFIRGEDLLRGATLMDWKGLSYRLPTLEVRFFYHVLHATCQHQFDRFVHVMTMAHLIRKCPQMDCKNLHRMAVERGALVPLYYGLKFIHAFLPLTGSALSLMKDLIPSRKVRLAASLLTPYSILFATQTRGKFRRKIFRLAMSW